jgi:hypothetical protein
VPAGSDSQEAPRLAAQDAHTLAAVYPSASLIPDQPHPPLHTEADYDDRMTPEITTVDMKQQQQQQRQQQRGVAGRDAGEDDEADPEYQAALAEAYGGAWDAATAGNAGRPPQMGLAVSIQDDQEILGARHFLYAFAHRYTSISVWGRKELVTILCLVIHLGDDTKWTPAWGLQGVGLLMPRPRGVQLRHQGCHLRPLLPTPSLHPSLNMQAGRQTGRGEPAGLGSQVGPQRPAPQPCCSTMSSATMVLRPRPLHSMGLPAPLKAGHAGHSMRMEEPP